MFLTSITSNLNLLIEKYKFFEHCGFVLEYESYNPDDDKVFEFLFQTVLIYLDEYISNFLTPSIFKKLLNFDKIYLSQEIKDSKKIYSKMIRKCLSLCLITNNEECFKIYIKKIKNLRGVQSQNTNLVQSIYSHITEEELSEEAENYVINPLKMGHKNISEISLSKKVKLSNEEKEKEEKN